MVDKKRFEVFHEKKAAKYNKMVLKVLYENGYLSSWELARKIVENDAERQKKNWYHETQKVQSVLVRKNGRLTDLVNKEFIEKTDKGYCLTFNKGFCSALVLYDEIPKPAIDEATKIDAILPELKEILDIVSRLHPEAMFEGYKAMREITIELLEKGLNFESISNREFNRFFADQYEESYLEELKKGKNDEKKWEAPPELKEATQKFIFRLVAICQKQIKELEDLKNSYIQNNQKVETE